MSDRPPFLEIKDWAKHQHYKDPRPPWIKLYGALLDDADFLGLPDAAQLQLIKLWLLASRMGHPLPNNPKLLAGKIGCLGKFNLSAIIAAGFVKEVSRESLDKSYTDPTPLSTEVREQRTERALADEAGKEFDSLRSKLEAVGDLKHMPPETITALPARTKHALSKIGGHVTVKRTPADKLVWLRRDFVKAYADAQRGEVQ